MSEPEALELIAIYAANAINSFTVFISLTFACLTVAYFVGRVLSRFQTIAVSGLYLASSITVATSCVISTQAWGALIAKQATVLDSLVLYRGGFWDIYVAVLMAAILAVSIYFMVDVCHRELGKNDELHG